MLLLLGLVGGGAGFLLPRMFSSAAETGPMMCTVALGDFLNEVTEQGNVESASNVEIRCEVKSEGNSGTQILRIADEGSYVKKGDFLVEFDSSARQKELITQQIACHNSQAEVIKAKMTLATAELAKREYENGTFIQTELTLLAKLAVADETKRRAEEFLRYREALERKGYILASHLAADQFALKKADNDYKAADTELMVLRDYTKAKMLGQLQSDIDTAKATLAAKEASDQLEQTKLADIEAQIAKCLVTAPSDGQVVYANVTDNRGNNQIIIEPGTQIREMQEVIRLPDPTRMQVLAKINESKILYVRKGMPVQIRVEAISDDEIPGIVEKVNEYPVASGFFTASIKEYEATIRILTIPPGLRPGLTAEVRIQSEYIPKARMVPVQSVFEHGRGRYFCVLRESDRYVAHQVQVGASNDQFVVVRGGLKESQQIVLHAAAYREKVDLPELPPEEAERGNGFSNGSNGSNGASGFPPNGGGPAGAAGAASDGSPGGSGRPPGGPAGPGGPPGERPGGAGNGGTRGEESGLRGGEKR